MKQNIWAGILWKIASCACFAIVNAIVRWLSGGYHKNPLTPLSLTTIMFYQNLISLIIIFLIMVITKKKWQLLLQCKYHLWHWLRVTTAVLGIGLWYLSLKNMPLHQVIAISFISPVITLISSIIFLKERLSLTKILIILLIIIGGFLVSRPDKNIGYQWQWIMLLPVLASFIFAFDKVLVRKLMAAGESPATLTFFLIVFTCLSCFLITLNQKQNVTLHHNHYLWLSMLGLFGFLAHYTFSRAYIYAEIITLMPFGLSKFVIYSFVSYIAFNEFPSNSKMWFGCFIILFSILLLEQTKKSIPTI